MEITLRTIPLSQLVPSPANVRRTNPTEAAEELAASIAAHGLLQNLTVRAAPAKGKRKGAGFEVVAGGRRLAALKLLVAQGVLTADHAVPCHVVESDAALEISLAENAMQCPMHPADQHEAFAQLHGEQGLSAEDIAARFGVTATVVRQRLKLGAISPVLMAAYRDGALNLDQLTAFTITDDHAAQERVWAELPPFGRSRAAIMRRLSEGQVPSDDRRVCFVGLDAYEAAGGTVIRDLFDEDGGGFLADAVLLDGLVRAKLQQEADLVAAEGWQWVTVVPEFDYGHAADMRRIYPEQRELSDDEQEEVERLEAEHDALVDACDGEVNETNEAEFARIEAALDALTGVAEFRPEDIARAGVFVTLDADGDLRIERGFVRAGDDPAETETEGKAEAKAKREGPAPLSAALIAELTAARTVALANELAQKPDVALTAVVHALASVAFHGEAAEQSCVQVSLRRPALSSAAPAIADDPAFIATMARHRAWQERLPDDPAALWPFVAGLDLAERMALLAHCTALSVNAVHPANGRIAPAVANQVDRLAQAVDLDMRHYWQPAATNYLGRVSKERILDAVREGVTPEAANNLAGLKKAALAQAAEQRLSGRGWLPEVLRTPAVVTGAATEALAAE